MPSPVIVFKDVYRFMDDKALSRKERQDEVFLLAEGFQDGKKVAEHNKVVERTYKLEGRMTEAEHDIRDLKARA